jgi:O-antigen ligase
MDGAASNAAGLLLAIVFLATTVAAPRAALYIVTVVSSLQLFEAFSFSGSRVEQGFFPVEILASACLLVVALRALSRGLAGTASAIDWTFLLIIGVGGVSLLVNLSAVDPAVDQAHVKSMVSLGQIALFAWPWALYRFVAEHIESERTARGLLLAIVLLAVPSMAVPFAPDAVGPIVRWSIYFGLAATPFCFAVMFFVRSVALRLLLLALALSPAVTGFLTGKTFLYAFVAVSAATVGLIRRPRLVLAAATVIAGVYLTTVLPVSQSVLPTTVQELVEKEESQGSWGGKSGRAQLAMDALWIWRQHPTWGVGPGNSWPYMHRYSAIDTPHNQYLNLLLETGLVGLAAFLALLCGCLRVGWRLYRTAETPFVEMFALGWLGYFLGMTLGGLTGDFILHSIRNGGLKLFTGFYLQWVLLGILVGLDRIRAREHAVVDEARAA